MISLCGMDCCTQCSKLTECGGCAQTNGHPFGGTCIAAEIIKRGGFESFAAEKQALIAEINALAIPGITVTDMNLMNGCYLNLAYPLPNGTTVKLLDDKNIYWANQIEILGTGRCYGIGADDNVIFVSQYSGMGENPELVLYKKRAKQ